jgi:MFS family permease
MVALPLEVLHLTGSPLDLAIAVSARTISTVILLLIGGTFVDRLPRRPVMLISDTGCGISVSLIAILAALSKVHLWELVLLSIIFGAASAFFKPAATAIVRDILPADLLVRASSLSSLSQSLAQFLIGPLAGGVIVAAAGTGWAFAIDGASFAVSAACLAAMRKTAKPAARTSGLLAELIEGLRYCYVQRWLAFSIVAMAIANLACFSPFYILEPLLARDAFHAGPVALGILYAASGGGGALASLAVTRREAPRHPVTTMWTTWGLAGVCAAFVGLSPWLWTAVLFAGVTWGLVSYGNVLWFPLIQQETPPQLLGRVSSVDWLFSLALTPLGVIAAGAAAAIIGVRLTLIAGGAIAAAAGSVLLIPGVTDPDKRATSNPA